MKFNILINSYPCIVLHYIRIYVYIHLPQTNCSKWVFIAADCKASPHPVQLHSISFTFHLRSCSQLVQLARPSICPTIRLFVRWIKWRLTNVKTANMCSRSPLAMAAAKVILFIALAGRLAGFSADPKSNPDPSLELQVMRSRTFYHNNVDMVGPLAMLFVLAFWPLRVPWINLMAAIAHTKATWSWIIYGICMAYKPGWNWQHYSSIMTTIESGWILINGQATKVHNKLVGFKISLINYECFQIILNTAMRRQGVGPAGR